MHQEVQLYLYSLLIWGMTKCYLCDNFGGIALYGFWWDLFKDEHTRVMDTIETTG